MEMSNDDKQEPMTRRNMFLPDWQWDGLQAYAIELTVKEGKPVSVAEAQRRINERFLSRRTK
jgi:hypothetical protein